VGIEINNKNGEKMMQVFHAKEFGDNTKGYTKVAEVNVDTINKAFHLTNNIDGSWSRGPEFQYNGVHGWETVTNSDFSDLVTVTTDLPISKKTGEVMGLRSTSSGDVIFDGNKYWFLVPLGAGRTGPVYKTHGKTVAIDNFDIDGFIYDDKEVA
tara:strand:- start:210 stop:671 length:462 start_codon:yes stop_codon:yes gene_type:complete